jgi:hypothetical protein
VSQEQTFLGEIHIIAIAHVTKKIWLMAYGDSRHFQKYFSYIVVVSFIGGRNRSTKRKPPTGRKSLTMRNGNTIYFPQKRLPLAYIV